MGDKPRQDIGKADTPSNKGKQEGRWETRQKGRQDRGKADTPSKAEAPTQAHISRETMKNKTSRRRTIQHRHTCGETMRDHMETMGNNWRQPETGIDKKGDNGRQKGETRRQEGGRTIQHRHTCGETMGDKGRKGETRPREGGHCQKIIGYKKY